MLFKTRTLEEGRAKWVEMMGRTLVSELYTLNGFMIRSRRRNYSRLLDIALPGMRIPVLTPSLSQHNSKYNAFNQTYGIISTFLFDNYFFHTQLFLF